MNKTNISVGGGLCINPEEITKCKADVNYTHIFFSNGKRIVVATTLKKIEIRFQPFPRFFRISKSIIINLDCIRRIVYPYVILQNGERFSPSRRRRKAFFDFINT